MANQDFDTLVVNPLERPLSSDIDALQSQLNRTIRDVYAAYFSHGGGTPTDGFIAAGFKAVTVPGVLSIKLSAGLGFQFTSNSQSNINSVSGLNDLSQYKPLLLTQDKTIAVGTLAGLTSAGNCRRDVVVVKWDRTLSSNTAYLWNAPSNSFTPTPVAKNMTFDLSSADVQVIQAGSPDAPVQPILYLKGAEVPFSTENSFLSAPIAGVPTGYVPVAILNITDAETEILTKRIADYRPLLFQYGNTSLSSGVTVTDALGTCTGARANLPASGQIGVLYTPGTQRVRFCFFAGNLSSSYVNIGRRAYDLAAQSATYDDNTGIFISCYEYAILANTSGFATVSESIQNALNGTVTTDFSVVNAIDVAVGQPYIVMDAFFGVRTSTFRNRVDLKELPKDTSTGTPLAYTFSAQADIRRV